MKQLSDDEIAELLLEEEPLFRRIRTGKRPITNETTTEQPPERSETTTEAFKRGISTGRQEAALVIAKRLLLRGCDFALVQEVTGLSTAQINRLQSLIRSS